MGAMQGENGGESLARRAASTMKVGNYELGKTIGQGRFGRVRIGIDSKDGKEYAVKIMHKSEIVQLKLTTNVRREISIMKQLKHRNIVGLHEVLSSPRKIYMIMDLVRGGELFPRMDRAGETGEDMVRRYFQQLVDGLVYCHSRGVCHRDLKPENLLVDEHAVLKVTDFGVSTVVKNATSGDIRLLHTACGTPYYCAPEILEKRDQGYDGIKVDSWSAGVILYRMLVGQLPFQGRDLPQLIKALQRGNVVYPTTLSKSAIALLKSLLEKNPERRMSMHEVKRHPWFLIDYDKNRAYLARVCGTSNLERIRSLRTQRDSAAANRLDAVQEMHTTVHERTHSRGSLREFAMGRAEPLANVPRTGPNMEVPVTTGSFTSSGDDTRNATGSFDRGSLSTVHSSSSTPNAKDTRWIPLLPAAESHEGTLEEFMNKILASKQERVPDVIKKLQEAGCEDIDDFKMVLEQYNTTEDLIRWLESKANVQPVLAIRLARGLRIHA